MRVKEEINIRQFDPPLPIQDKQVCSKQVCSKQVCSKQVCSKDKLKTFIDKDPNKWLIGLAVFWIVSVITVAVLAAIWG